MVVCVIPFIFNVYGISMLDLGGDIIQRKSNKVSLLL